MNKIVSSHLRKLSLVKLGIMLPVILALTYGSWCSLLILLSVWSYCVYGALFGREDDIKVAPPVKVKKPGDLADGNSGYLSLADRDRAFGRSRF